jgi:hypothetical protein
MKITEEGIFDEESERHEEIADTKRDREQN